jgi:hypothetical protein
MHARLFLKSISLYAAWAVMAHVSSYAAQFAYPTACYSGDELAAVRAWEQTWSGEKITSGNVDEVRQFFAGKLLYPHEG